MILENLKENRIMFITLNKIWQFVFLTILFEEAYVALPLLFSLQFALNKMKD